jgi:multidrug efflux system outer membrane protein
MGVGLTGCLMIPRYERPVAPLAATYPDSSKGGQDIGEATGWRQVYRDERLQALIGLALTNNPDLRLAALRVEQNRAQYRITRSALLPTVQGGGGLTLSGVDDRTTEQWSASLGSTAYEVDFFGRVRSLNRQALEKFLGTTEAQRSAQLALVAEVATQYFAWRQAEAQGAWARETLSAVEEIFALNRANFEAGASPELDLRTSEAQVQTAKINVLNYERRRRQTENQLAQLLGVPVPTDLPAPRPFDEASLVAEVPAGLPSELVERRPDLREAEHSLQAAQANVGAARAAFFPSVRLTGSLGTASSQLDQLFGAGTGVWSFSPQITVPLFTGGRNRADLDAARVGVRLEVVTYQKTIQTAFREVADALVAARTFAEQLEEQATLIRSQQRRFELALARFRQGDTAYLDVLLAQQDLYSARQAELETRFNLFASRIALYRALGGGWH